MEDVPIENILKTSEKNYQDIFNLLPESVIIISDDEIVLANERALKIDNSTIGRCIYDIAPNFKSIIKKRISQILSGKKTKTSFDYKMYTCDGRVFDIEVSSSYMIYKDKPAVVSILRDITKMKNSLNSAAKIQRIALQQNFPLMSRANMETVYVPAKTVSGDFFHINKIDDYTVVGVIGDVRGKGITAALNISACNVLFHESVLINDDPEAIIKYLNKKIVDYLGESYVAASCFKLDFKNKKATIVGAGINEFILHPNKGVLEKKVIKGPFLGMFEDSIFDKELVDFNKGDKFYFFTDGLEFILEDILRKNYDKTTTLTSLKEYLGVFLSEMLTDVDGIKDDCTLIALEIK